MPTPPLSINPPLHPTIHNPHSHTPFPPSSAVYIVGDDGHTNTFDCYVFHIQINVTVVLLPFTLQMLQFHALPCWGNHQSLLGNHQSLLGNQIAIIGFPVGNHIPIKFGKLCHFCFPFIRVSSVIIVYIIESPLNSYLYKNIGYSSLNTYYYY